MLGVAVHKHVAARRPQLLGLPQHPRARVPADLREVLPAMRVAQPLPGQGAKDERRRYPSQQQCPA